MTEVRSTLPELAAYLRSLPALWSLRRDGLAEEMAARAADRIYGRFVREAGSEGPFAANRGTYGTRKAERGVPIGIGLHGDEIGGQMARRENFDGDLEFAGPDEAAMLFGADDASRRKGMWFQSGSYGYDEQDVERSGSQGQPSRPFYFLLEEDLDDVFGIYEDRIAARLGLGA